MKPTSLLMVGLPTGDGMPLSPQRAYGGYHSILEPLNEKIRISDTCYLLDTDAGHPFISKVMDYCSGFSRAGELQFPVLLIELGDSPITTIRLSQEAKEWLDSRGIRSRSAST